MKLQADTGSNLLPLTFSNIHGTVFDLETDDQVATGDTGRLTVPAKDFPVINLNLNFTFSAVNDSDTTCKPLLAFVIVAVMIIAIVGNNWYDACNNKALHTNGERPPVQFRLVLDMKIDGLLGTKHTSTQVTDANCPIELPENSV